MLIGAHVPTSGGYAKTAAYAAEVGCEAIQIFAKSPRQWKGAAPDPAAAALLTAERAERGIGPVFTHTSYLINLGSADEAMWTKSVEALADELTRAALLSADGAISHIGTRFVDDDAEASADRVADAVARAYELAQLDPGRIRLLLENTAGAGRTFGGSFAELGAIVAMLDARGLEGVGLCIDTCHAWAAGLDVATAAGWTELLDTIEGCCGVGRIGAIHANDCKFGRGEHKDRHEWIGDGHIGYPGFEAMVCQRRLATVPALLEMPGEMPIKDAENIRRLKELRTACAGA